MCPILKGGARDRRVKSISKGRRIDHSKKGFEGAVREVIVTLAKGVRERKVKLAEKEFYSYEDLIDYIKVTQPNLRNPSAQFQVFEKLKKLNKTLGLRLPLLTTLRIREMRNGDKRFYLTLLKNVLRAEPRTDGTVELYSVKKKKLGVPSSKLLYKI